MAQLNIEEDRLAGEFQKYHCEFRPLVTILSSCPAMFLIRGISIKIYYNKQLVKECVKPQYIGYLQEKYNWSGCVFQLIAWKISDTSITTCKRRYCANKDLQWFTSKSRKTL